MHELFSAIVPDRETQITAARDAPRFHALDKNRAHDYTFHHQKPMLGEKMKKLFTIDDFMVAFISALGYGLGAEIPMLLGSCFNVGMGTLFTLMTPHFLVNR